MTGLTVRGLCKAYGATRVLDGIDLQVSAGSFTAILGPSGCGKTTLLRLVAGFDQPDAGSIELDGRSLFRDGQALPPEQRRIGYVAQEGALFPHLTVAGNISFGLPFLARRSGQRVPELLELVGLDQAYAERYPHQLSGGQQQRVALARALAPAPSVILLDEPFASLDAGLRDGTRRAVARTLAAAKATTILVTHDQSEALSMADQVAVMRDGRLAQTAAPADLYRHPVDAETASFVGEAVILVAQIHDGVADCALGRLPVAPDTAAGPAQVMVRPEQISLHPATTPGATPATVLDVTYYGHDTSVRLELASGLTVTARAPGYAIPSRGHRVGLIVRQAVHVFS